MLEKRLNNHNHSSCWLLLQVSFFSRWDPSCRRQKLETAGHHLVMFTVLTFWHREEHHNGKGEQENPTTGRKSCPHLQMFLWTLGFSFLCSRLLTAQLAKVWWRPKQTGVLLNSAHKNRNYPLSCPICLKWKISCCSDDRIWDRHSHIQGRCIMSIYVQGCCDSAVSCRCLKIKQSHKLLFSFGLHHFIFVYVSRRTALFSP